jgi:hypothetical protein
MGSALAESIANRLVHLRKRVSDAICPFPPRPCKARRVGEGAARSAGDGGKPPGG